jgi:hypothetical protein
MAFAIYLDAEAAGDGSNAEDYLVPDFAELRDYLIESVPDAVRRSTPQITLAPAHDVAMRLPTGEARRALLALEEPSMVLVVPRP